VSIARGIGRRKTTPSDHSDTALRSGFPDHAAPCSIQRQFVPAALIVVHGLLLFAPWPCLGGIFLWIGRNRTCFSMNPFPPSSAQPARNQGA